MDKITPLPELASLVRWSDYAASLPNLFPSRTSAQWFLRSRKDELTQRGILLGTVRGYLVRRDLLDDCLLELLSGKPEESDDE